MIFLIGSQKSGTTWLRDCFAHVVTVPKRQEWYFAEFYERLLQHIVQYGHLDEVQRNAACRRVAAAAWRELLDAVTPGAIFDKSAYPCTPAIGQIRNDLHPLAVRLARQVFPDARTVVIVRDPRAVLNSTIQYVNHFRPGVGNIIDPTEFGATWQIQNAHWLDDAPSVVVRYEDLKADFTGTLARLFAALDLPHDRDLLARIHQTEFNIDAVRPRQPEIYRKGTVDDYRTHLSPAAIAQVTAAAVPLMDRLGYAASGTLNRLPRSGGHSAEK